MLRAAVGVALLMSCEAYRMVGHRSLLPLPLAAVSDVTEITSSSTINTSILPIDHFISSYKSALKGDTSNLYGLLQSTSTWESPVAGNLVEVKNGLKQFNNFFKDAGFTVFKQSALTPNSYKIDYQLSFWYPMPWRPRIIIPGSVVVQLSSDTKSVVSVKDTWEISVIDILTQQLPFRFWDLWNSFSTPAPEYPPIKILTKVDKVSFVEMPQTVALEVRWSGSAKYPGPPLLAIPGFALFGYLRTSRPNRDPYYTVLPVEVESGRFYSEGLREEMKRTSWLMHVPSHLHDKVMARALEQTVFLVKEEEEVEGEDDLVEKTDYQVGQENVNVMKSATGGTQRGNIAFDPEKMRDFESKETKEFLYRVLPRRLIAQVDIKGEATPEKISAALQIIKDTVVKDGSRVLGRAVKMKLRDDESMPGLEGAPALGLQMWACKACFNERAEPAMAAYELQYDKRLTKVFVELIVDR
jgi:hypothetical protein